MRPYTPISTNADKGTFDLLVKCYELGELSKVLGEMPIGDTSVSFKHIDFNVKLQYPFGKKRIGMIAGGSGITPMIQALRALIEPRTIRRKRSGCSTTINLQRIFCAGICSSRASRDDGFR